jgi:glucose/arabinose dehydrogenase
MSIRRSLLLHSFIVLGLLAGCAGAVASPTTPAQATLPAVTATLPAGPLPTLAPVTQEPTPVESPVTLPSGVATLPLPENTAMPGPLDVTQFPNPDEYQWQVIANGLQIPVNMETAFDATGRLFINEKPGRIRILQSGELLEQPFLDITDRVGSSSSEQGLLGLAFHPRYEENGRFFVHYSDRNGDTVLSRFQVSADDPNRADPSSEVILLQQDQPYANHNGGQLAFGPDGYLYLGLGDGGSAGDPQNNAQSLETWLGKILRLDVDQGDTYAIPADNPFLNGKAKPEIWAYGLRNPWRFSFDTRTGEMYIADVGQNQWEEIDYLPAGSPGGTNFGWRLKEASHPYEGGVPADALLVDPVFEYDHSLGCSVTGGFVYRGQNLPEWQGIYIFGDYCGGRIWGLMRQNGQWVGQEMFTTGTGLTAFGQDETGEVYLLDGAGSVLRLERR